MLAQAVAQRVLLARLALLPLMLESPARLQSQAEDPRETAYDVALLAAEPPSLQAADQHPSARQRVEALMADYFRHARAVARVLDRARRTAPKAMARATSTTTAPKRRF